MTGVQTCALPIYCNNLGIQNHIVSSEKNSYEQIGGSTRFFRFKYYLCTWEFYSKRYKHYKIEDKSSAVVIAEKNTETEVIYNINRYVKYRPK